jgi:ferric-dicitrate binding protein FerR (iron transport regulator)
MQEKDVFNLLTDESFCSYCLKTNAEDVEYWENWLEENPSERENIESQKNLVILLANETAAQVTQNEYQKLQRRIQLSEKNNGKIFPLIIKWAVAASLVISLSFGYYFYHKAQNNQQIAASVSTKTVPGNTKAILILANGQKIELSAAASGTIATQSNTAIRKTNDGRIIYDGDSENLLYNTTITPRGGKFDLTLADGTKVSLDAASSIKYPVSFTGKERKVEITGQVYFEVAHNAAKPFRVLTRGQTIEVLGTHFNVNAYDDEPTIKTTLLEGKVNINYLGINALLKPGEQASVKSGISDIRVKAVDTELVIAWKNGLFRFNKTDLRSVMRQISRWYDMEVIYPETLKNTDLFGGSTPRSANVQSILRKLEVTGHVQFTVNDNKIIILSK